MSFLKIGDRAAGAIKSGGTTRRAAKMVVPRPRPPGHRGVRQLEGARGAEGRRPRHRVAAAEQAPERRHQGDPRARRPRPSSSTRRRTPALRKAVLDARAALIPENYIARVLQLAKQGFTRIEIEEYDTDWNSKAYYTVSGQNSNNSVRITNDFMKAVENDGPWHLYWRTELEKAAKEGRAPKPKKTLQGPRAVGPDRLRRVELRRPRRAVRHHDQRVAHLPGRRPHQRDQPVLASTCSSTTRRATSRR